MESTLKEKLLMLAESDFAADDIKLYLDTHPDDAGMIMKLCLQAQKSMMLRNEIETRFRLSYHSNDSLNLRGTVQMDKCSVAVVSRLAERQ